MSILRKPIGAARYCSTACLAVAMLGFHVAGSAAAADIATSAATSTGVAPPSAVSAGAELNFFSDVNDYGFGDVVGVYYTISGKQDRYPVVEGIEGLGKNYPAKVRADTIAKRLNDLYVENPGAFKNLFKDTMNGFPIISAPGLRPKPLVTMDSKMMANNADSCGTDPGQALDWLINQIFQAVKGKSRDFVPLSEMKPAEILEVANGYRQNGDDALRAGNLKEAEERYNQALELNPNYVEAYLRLGSTLLKDRQKDKALAALQSAKTKNLNDAQQQEVATLTRQINDAH